MIKKEGIIKILERCYDPEIPIDVWNLGLIYDIEILKDTINITMSLTTPGCTMAEHIANNIKNQIKTDLNVQNVNISITFDPVWEPNMMTELGKEKLGFKVNKKTDNEQWE